MLEGKEKTTLCHLLPLTVHTKFASQGEKKRAAGPERREGKKAGGGSVLKKNEGGVKKNCLHGERVVAHSECTLLERWRGPFTRCGWWKDLSKKSEGRISLFLRRRRFG